jgi:hypothetical protein
VGGPIRRDRTFFFFDYQGQQTIGRTVISTVPTALQRQGIFTETIGGRVPVIYDPATTVLLPGGRAARSPFPGNTIPADRIDPVARALLDQYPLPTSSGTANNYRRTAARSSISSSSACGWTTASHLAIRCLGGSHGFRKRSSR